MSEITVTMPLKEYQKLIDQLRETELRSINNYITTEGVDILRNQWKRTLDIERIKKDFDLT